ncbi:MAG: GNAT family N-acetyltransferase [Alphaproteobacteria bacterium]|nr:GNAT family N-acetyltransferase [Alphaproteobacteria bacterium]
MNDLAIPDPAVETERLFLPRLTEEDAGDFAALFANDWDAVKHTGQLPFPATAATMRVWIRRHTGPGGHAFLLRRKVDDRAMGAIGFGGRGPVSELGYALGRAFWGQGYATEAAFAMIDVARSLGLGGLQAYSFVENPASARVLEKAGFSKVGTIVREYPKRGGMRRVIHFRTML